MSTQMSEGKLEDRLVAVEQEWAEANLRLARLEAAAIEARLLVPLRPPASPVRRAVVQQPSVTQPPSASPAAPSVAAVPPRPAARSRIVSPTALTDVIGGRGLAWLGGAAMLLGIVLLLALAISRGWIGEEMRVLLAAAASSLLVIGGAWLHRRSGRMEAAVAMVGAGTAGMFATLIVASAMYGLLAAPLALAAGMFTGAVAATLAIRWAGQAIGALGLLGALLTPILLGASNSGISIAFLLIATAGSMVVVVGRRWGWLGFGAVLLAEPQLAAWLWRPYDVVRPLSGAVVAMVAFAVLAIAGAAGLQLRAPREHVDRAAAALLVLSAAILAVAGRAGLTQIAGGTVASLWLLALAAGHCTLATLGRRLPRVVPLRPVAFVIAAALADAAFALSFHGLVLSLGWGAAAMTCASLAARRRAQVNAGPRRPGRMPGDEALAQLGLGAHIALVLIHTMLAVPPSVLGTDESTSTALAAVAALAAACVGSARLAQGARQEWRVALDGLGLLAIAYLTTIALTGPLLVVAWSAEAVALGALARRHRDPVAWIAAAGFLTLAAVHATAVEAPPSALIVGVPSLAAAAVALIALAGASIGLSRSITDADGNVAGVEGISAEMARLGLVVGAVAALTYLASVAIIGVFQPAAGTDVALLDLGVRQQGQVLLSVLWSLAGASVLLVGLRHRIARLRTGALALLLLVTAKVFLYDLSTLTSIYRVASFIALGLLLLAAGFAYGKLRPAGADRNPTV
jgi:uncharacterized membrane protein